MAEAEVLSEIDIMTDLALPFGTVPHDYLEGTKL